MSFQPTLLRFDSIDSTNLEAMRQAKSGAPEGLCIVAREQTAGRGRLDRKWHSPRDSGLYFSVVLRPRFEMSAWPLITLMAALATVDALLSACGLQADIKWPNDLCVGERKLCGILAETVETTDGPAAILGIGINLSPITSAEIAGTATSIQEVIDSKPEAERIVSALIETLRVRYQLLDTAAGREHLLREWCANSSYAFDREVRVSTANGSFTGVTRGLGSDGSLRVETPDGKVTAVRAGEITAVRPARSAN
jgi:BirA family transcriptional regulator, biotin operon repressor / biotin---[acetyl-CoA-carboxylase] ligase